MSEYDRILKWICEHDAAICNHPYVFSCTWCAEQTGIPVKKVRQIMKQLEQDGYVYKNHEGGYDDWCDRIYCIHGYSVTEKARKHHFWIDRREEDKKFWDSL